MQSEGKKVTSEILIRGVLIVIIYALSLKHSLFGVVLGKEGLGKYFAHWLQFDLEQTHRKMDYEFL